MTNGDEFSAESLRNQSAVKPAQSHLKDLSGIAEGKSTATVNRANFFHSNSLILA
jgi:hypothetical protein